MSVPTPEELASLAYERFRILPKTGKPADTEWTILSAILLYKQIEAEAQVIAIGCGTKCIGKSKLCNRGLILNDCHAEVLARRAFMRYIYYHLKKAAQTTLREDNIFLWDSERMVFRLRPHLSFHFFSTHTPCGDACIARDSYKRQQHHNNDEPVVSKKRKIDIDEPSYDVGHVPTSTTAINLIYTGAKLIGLDEQQDIMEQSIGAMRTKPGRGDRTLSMSCSDKLARWNVLGVQGALLDVLLSEPIYFETLNFCGSVHNKYELRCAIYERFSNGNFVSNKYKVQKPVIRTTKDVMFEYAQGAKRPNPSSTGLIWCNIDQQLKPYEVAVNGKRLGVTKKKLRTPHASLNVSKYHLMAEFVELLRLKPEFLKKLKISQNELQSLKYNQCKQLANEYQTAWTLAKQNYFKQWTQKPADLLKFCLISDEMLT
ncbi:tRNA-specific adenosine deaminase 1 [Eurosta solidaginis]|uniref:tRNA-specific adenosine deaminase 1 n=1 Tax=Eurosta solidaginis TaxID=178769 RepID=UPI0035308375